jgi:hypothetical protein
MQPAAAIVGKIVDDDGDPQVKVIPAAQEQP